MIYDELHGFIEASSVEERIIDTPVFQRLRRIRQLSAAFLAYPGAVHTRFNHSLGVMHIAGLIASRLVSRGFLEEGDVALARLAGLLHDVGHPPMSHTLEAYYSEKHGGRVHEELGALIVENDPQISSILEENGYDPRRISGIFKDGEGLLGSIVSGDLDADRLDYLLRDAMHTGVAYGLIELDRIISTVTATSRGLGVEAKGISAVDSFYVARLHMYQAVYYHKTITGFELLLKEFYSRMLDEVGLTQFMDLNGLRELVESGDYVYWDDVWILHMVKEAARRKLEVSARTSRLAAMFLHRKPPRLVYDASRLAWSKRDADEIAAEARERCSECGEECMCIADMIPVINEARAPLVKVRNEEAEIYRLESSLTRHLPRWLVVARVYEAG